jgi:hypothetical protein
MSVHCGLDSSTLVDLLDLCSWGDCASCASTLVAFVVQFLGEPFMVEAECLGLASGLLQFPP